MGQGKPPELRTHAKRITSGRNMTPEEIAAAKNSRSHQRNLERKANKRAEAEARNNAYQAAVAAGERHPRTGAKVRKLTTYSITE